jgi:ABC-2 type transport system permease protein
MTKSYLVAKREFVENLRTKTFWIGILAMPILLVLSGFGSYLMQSTKDVRRYAVVDESGWLLDAVEDRAGYDDKLRMFHYLRDQAREGGRSLEKLPDALREVALQVKDLEHEGLVFLAKMTAAQEKALLENSDPEAAAAAMTPEMQAQALDAIAYLSSLSPEDARQLLPRLTAGRYQRVDIPPGTADPEAWAREQFEAEKGKLFAYFVLCADPVASSDGSKYVSNNRTDPDLRQWFAGLASDIVREKRFEAEGVDASAAARIQERFVFEEKKVSEDGEEKVKGQDFVRQFAPVIFTYLLWFAVFIIANMLLTNTIEEKSNRLIEVLLSSVSPLQLMAGKTLGIAATGMTMVLSWVFFFLLGLKLLPKFVKIPDNIDFSILVGDPIFLGSFVFYFLAGYLLYAAALVGIGSICNSLKEAQNFMLPITGVLMIPLLALLPIAQDPNGGLAKTMSWIPPFTPFVMMNRAAGPPSAWEYLGTTVVLILAIALAFWAAAKIFRIGILMTGKPPSPLEVLRWLKTPVGAQPQAKD